MIKDIYRLFLLITGMGFVVSIFRSGVKNQKNKQLKAKEKQNEKHSKNSKLIANMSNDELRDYLRK